MKASSRKKRYDRNEQGVTPSHCKKKQKKHSPYGTVALVDIGIIRSSFGRYSVVIRSLFGRCSVVVRSLDCYRCIDDHPFKSNPNIPHTPSWKIIYFAASSFAVGHHILFRLIVQRTIIKHVNLLRRISLFAARYQGPSTTTGALL